VSRSRALLELALVALERQDVGSSRLIDLAQLPADALLGRRKDQDVSDAIHSVITAGIIVVSTPIYRATYSGLLKVFFDLLPPDALIGKVAIPIATGGGPSHLLAVDHGLRPLLASVGALVVATGVYGTDAQFRAGVPEPALVERIERAVLEALAIEGVRA
jgi:FMN reductase